jgi:hypothetical protein
LEATFYEEAVHVLDHVTDGSDLLHCFPRLTVEAFDEVLYYLRQTGQSHKLAEKEIARELDSLRTSRGPYGYCGIYERVWQHWYQRRQEKLAEQRNARRETEMLFLVTPGTPPLLADESLPGYGLQCRNSESFQWTEERLSLLAFHKVVDASVASYQRSFEKGVLYGDPRAEGRIDFWFCCAPQYKFSTYPNDRRRLTIFDTWRHNVEAKLLEWVKWQSESIIDPPRRVEKKKETDGQQIKIIQELRVLRPFGRLAPLDSALKISLGLGELAEGDALGRSQALQDVIPNGSISCQTLSDLPSLFKRLTRDLKVTMCERRVVVLHGLLDQVSTSSLRSRPILDRHTKSTSKQSETDLAYNTIGN